MTEQLSMGRFSFWLKAHKSVADLGGGCRGCAPPPEMTCGFLIQLVLCKKKKAMWFIGVEVEQETSAPPPKKNPGSAPANSIYIAAKSPGRTSLNFLEPPLLKLVASKHGLVFVKGLLERTTQASSTVTRSSLFARPAVSSWSKESL